MSPLRITSGVGTNGIELARVPDDNELRIITKGCKIIASTSTTTWEQGVPPRVYRRLDAQVTKPSGYDRKPYYKSDNVITDSNGHLIMVKSFAFRKGQDWNSQINIDVEAGDQESLDFFANRT